MSSYRRTAALTLAALITLGTMASCGESAESTPASTTSASDPGSSPAEETTAEETIMPDELPSDLDFGGREFRLGFQSAEQVPPAIAEEATGDVVNDAVFEANMRVSERLNVKLTTVLYDDGGLAPVKKAVMAGDNAYDAVTGHDISIGNLSITGIFMDLYNIGYLDFDKPWWPSYSVDSLTVNGHMVLLSGFNSYENLQGTRCIWMNKKLMTDYGKPLPYDSVRDGTWTLDMFIGCLEDVYQDLNGDNTRDEGDLYGWATASSLYAYQDSFGIEPYKEDENGLLYIDASDEKLLTLVNKTRHALYETDGGLVLEVHETTDEKFRNGTNMFVCRPLSMVSKMRDSDVEYGFLPMPKFDESQENYISGSTDRPYAVPLTASDTDFVGAVLEAMASEGYRTVRPAYFDIALKNKYTYDDDSAEMLDIIGNTIILDFAYIYSDYKGFAWTVMNLMAKNSNGDFASYAAKQEKSEAKRIDKLNAFFQELG
ncbi:MAG: extracellular solute-binding protein [Clostridia bacterium]|nr:extracellular solute-binding protein [Clostridia bacterium]